MFQQTNEITLWSLNHYVLCAVVVLVVVILVVVFYSWIYLKRAKEANIRQKEQNAHLALVLQAGRLRIWKYLPATRHYIILSEEGTMEQRYNPIDFAQFFDRDDFEQLRSAVFDICSGKKKNAVVTMVSNGGDNAFLRHYEMTVSVDHRNSKGQVTSTVDWSQSIRRCCVTIRFSIPHSLTSCITTTKVCCATLTSVPVRSLV